MPTIDEMNSLAFDLSVGTVRRVHERAKGFQGNQLRQRR